MKSDISKKWLKFSIINVVVLFLVYGILLAVLNTYCYTVSQNVGERMMIDYAEQLASEELEALVSHFDDKANYSYYNENFAFVLFQRRADGTLLMKTTNDFLAYHEGHVALDKSQVGMEKEDIVGKSMMTYQVKIEQGDSTTLAYIKVYMPLGVINATTSTFTLFIIIFAVIFIIVSIAASAAIGYLEIKPIALTYDKQKNFINDMSHEIRTPLAIIKGNLESAVMNGEARVLDIMDMLEESLEEVDHIVDMSSGLLNIVRSSNMTMKGQKGNICQVISEVIDVYSDLSLMQSKSLVASIDMINMQVDKEKFKQLLVILLDNALKYTVAGDRIKIKFKKSDRGAVLMVSDSGRGVPKEDLERIFERFYRSNNVADLQGTGLGLSIAKAIVENIQATIVAKQNSPRGLSVIVEFGL